MSCGELHQDVGPHSGPTLCEVDKDSSSYQTRGERIPTPCPPVRDRVLRPPVRDATPLHSVSTPPETWHARHCPSNTRVQRKRPKIFIRPRRERGSQCNDIPSPYFGEEPSRTTLCRYRYLVPLLAPSSRVDFGIAVGGG